MTVEDTTLNSEATSARRPARPRCFFDIAIGKDSSNLKPEDQTYRIIIELYADICPLTCENFRCLCTGERGLSTTGKLLSYKDSPFHRVIKNFMIQGGDIILGNGKSGESIYGKTFPDENFEIKHDSPYILSMANKGKDTNSSQFFITTVPSPHLDGKHVAFGQVISGQSAISIVENLPTDETGKPALPVTIVKCGELVLQLRPKETNLVEDTGSLKSYESSNEDDETKKFTGLQESMEFSEVTKTPDLPAPEIPRNFLSRSITTEYNHLMIQNPIDGLIGGKDNEEDGKMSIENQFLGAVSNEEKVKALGNLLSSHVPNYKELLEEGQVEEGGKRDAMAKAEKREEKNRRRSDRSRSPATRRKDVGRRSRSYERHRERNGDRSTRNEQQHRSTKKRIPAHIWQILKHSERSSRSRSRSRSFTPPHWKEAQKRLIKIDDLIKEEDKNNKQTQQQIVDKKKENYTLRSEKFDQTKGSRIKDRLGSGTDGNKGIKNIEYEDENEMLNLKNEQMAKAFWGPDGKPPSLLPTGAHTDGSTMTEKDWERAKLVAQMAHAELSAGNTGIYAGQGAHDFLNYTKPVIPNASKYNKDHPHQHEHDKYSTSRTGSNKYGNSSHHKYPRKEESKTVVEEKHGFFKRNKGEDVAPVKSTRGVEKDDRPKRPEELEQHRNNTNTVKEMITSHNNKTSEHKEASSSHHRHHSRQHGGHQRRGSRHRHHHGHREERGGGDNKSKGESNLRHRGDTDKSRDHHGRDNERTTHTLDKHKTGDGKMGNDVNNTNTANGVSIKAM